MFEFLKRSNKEQEQKDNIEVIRKRINRNQETVYKAVEEINRPVNGMAVAKHLGWDSASVTNRLAELTKKGRLKVAYNKRGLDGIWRRYYIVNEQKGSQID